MHFTQITGGVVLWFLPVEKSLEIKQGTATLLNSAMCTIVQYQAISDKTIFTQQSHTHK